MIGSISSAETDTSSRRTDEPAWEQLVEIVSMTADAVLAFDPDMRIRFSNVAARVLFDYTAEELAGMPLHQLVPYDLRSAHEEEVRGFLMSGARARMMAHRRRVEGVRKDGSILPLRISILKHRVPGPLCVTAIVRDISDFVARERELESALARARAADIAKSQFLANVTHELKTPLNPVIGFADMLALPGEEPLSPSQVREYAALIAESGRSLLALLEEMILAARLEAERIVPAREEVDLAGLAIELLASMEAVAAAAGIILAPTDLPQDVTCEGDAPLLRLALEHILRNALRYCPRHTTVWLSAEVGDETIVLVIADDGPGMDKAALRRTGEPFFQVDSSLTRRTGGLGLGLFIARRLCELHGGALGIESAPGAGTRVILSLPRSPENDSGKSSKHRGKT